MKGDAFVYVAMITMKKNWQTAIWPLCVGPRGAIQQQGSSLWAPFNDLAIWPMSLQWLVLFSNDLVMIYICMYVCMHACMYVCMHVCMHAWMYVCMNVCMHGTMRSIMSENVGKKWKVAEIENLPKLKGGGWNWNNFKKCLGVPPPKISRDREGVWFSLRPINKNEENPSQIDPRYHPRASDSGAECEEDPNDSDALRVPAPGRKVVFK